ncbi:RHS repeat-associated core domain-containing protein [Pseudomonas sp. 148P]|uniref:RHS repeat-associated core domain-containing protein n=1 Tax=Pseudomonas ulcerans TaxID=3115852 RepID=A0ABU7HWF9_9PSED|nr:MULTISPECIES: RHS repeat-associated core domain-containing protein [unclassified Pseudomonas]MEE1923503.1 RHS repeat-associated core domain-containing protein [Pseudomonas sp. 147P]MEE1935877.1 RHS repeat-associated core domain-containing protein [Pseudomonas sp. 148P]
MPAALHALTPVLAVQDPRGLALRKVDYCRVVANEVAERRVQWARHDALGHRLESRDPRLWALHGRDGTTPANLRQVHSLSGRELSRDSVDAGFACVLFGEAGQTVCFEDGKGTRRELEYDALLRPLALHEQGQCSERYLYADASAEHALSNACGRLLRHDDTAGSLAFGGYSLGGGVRRETRRFCLATDWPDWPVPIEQRDALLEPEVACSSWSHGPLGDLLAQVDAAGNRQRFGLTVAGELRDVHVQPGSGAEQPVLSETRYNAFGLMQDERLGNGVIIHRWYREEDGRLLRLLSRRVNGEALQDLHYSYDPVGNIVAIEDRAQPLRHFANRRIPPRCEYVHDSLYQLCEATGWEAGAVSRGPGSLLDPGAVSNYRQRYRYDAGGNLLELTHIGAQAHGRTLVAERHSNRCLAEGGDFAGSFDANGNLLRLQPGQDLLWNLRNELREVRPVVRDGAADDWELYLYDGAGQRVRKWASRQAANRTHNRETRYLPGLEQHSDSASGERFEVIVLQTGTCGVRILHWLDGRPDEVPQDQARYALGDHLGSSCLELDSEAALISHEVFHPFGSTAWWVARSEIEAGYKTLRYSGKERDATGLFYYGARYYRTDWQRWLSPDPAGVADGLNLYGFVHNAPMGFVDIHGHNAFPFAAIESSEVRAKASAGRFMEAQAQARREASKDIAVINDWIVSLVPTVDFQSMTLFDNRLNNSLYTSRSMVAGIDFIVKKMHSPERALREELAYRVSEALGFHVVPPAKARAKSLVQQRVPNIKDARGSERKLSDREKLFYFLINEFDDNSGNQLWDEEGGVQLIDHEAAFTTRDNAVYNLSTIDLTSALDKTAWERFKGIGAAEWKKVLGGDRPKLPKAEAKAFMTRVDATRKAMQKHIDRGAVGFGQRRGLLQKALGRKVA